MQWKFESVCCNLLLVLYCKKLYSTIFCFIHVLYMLKKIFLPLFIVSMIVLLLLSSLLYFAFDINFYMSHDVQFSTLSKQESIVYVQNVYDFLQEDVSSFLQEKDILVPLFTSDEEAHLQDVRTLFRIAFVVEIFALFVFSSCLLLCLFKKQFFLCKQSFLWAWSLVLCFLLLLFLLSFFNFDSVFKFFHQVFFPQGNRSFDESSMLIQLFPLSFFVAIATRIFLWSTGLTLVFFLVGIYGRKKK